MVIVPMVLKEHRLGPFFGPRADLTAKLAADVLSMAAA